MKALLLAFIFVSVSAFAAGPAPQYGSPATLKSKAQDNVTAAEQQQSPPEAPWLRQFHRGRPQNPDPGFVISPDYTSTRAGCAYIHAFIFEQRDDQAPKLVGESYCTPMFRAQLHSAKRPHPAPETQGPQRIRLQY